MRKWKVGFLKLIGTVVILFVTVAAAFAWLFVGYVPEPNFPEPASLKQAQLQDITWLRKYSSLDKSFDASSKAAFQSYLDVLEPRAGDMSVAVFELEVAKAVALADNGHTNISPIGRSRRVNRQPLRFAWFGEDLVITQTTRDHNDLLGKVITGFDQVSSAMAVSEVLPVFGGAENRRQFVAPLTLNSPDLLHAAGIARSAERVTLHFRDGSSNTMEVLLPDREHSTPYGRTLLEYAVPAHDEDEWVSLMQGKEPPLYLQDQGAPYVRRHLAESDLYYIKINYNYSVEGWDLSQWLREVESDLETLTPRYVAVDVRFNGGGTDITGPFAKALPSLLPADGLLFIITSAETFSAGVGVAAELKLQLGPQARIVGDLAGDRLRFWANGGNPFRLPNSGIAMPVWRGLEDYGEGCWSPVKCFWMSPSFMRRGVDTLEPDLSAPLSLKAYLANRDPSMDAILAEVKLHSGQD